MQRQRPPLTAVKSSPQLGKYPQIQVTPPGRHPEPDSPPKPLPPPKIAKITPSKPATSSSKPPPARQTRAGSADEPSTDCIEVPPELYAHIPVGAYIIYRKTADSGQFFGGFVKSHHRTNTGYMTLISHADSTTTYPLMHENVDKMWKKYYKPAFIELYMTRNALVRRREIVEDLQNQVATLLKRIERLEKKVY